MQNDLVEAQAQPLVPASISLRADNQLYCVIGHTHGGATNRFVLLTIDGNFSSVAFGSHSDFKALTLHRG